jgi:hypothetical protein
MQFLFILALIFCVNVSVKELTVVAFGDSTTALRPGKIKKADLRFTESSCAKDTPPCNNQPLFSFLFSHVTQHILLA